jgi:MFS family permease
VGQGPARQGPTRTAQRHTVRVILAASAALAGTVVPVFLTGALSGPIGVELGFGDTATGIAITVFFALAGVAAVPMSHLTRRLGARTAMRTGLGVSAVGCLLIASVVRSWWQLVVVLGVVGSVVGLADTAAAAAFAGTVRRARQGLAFGVKEASVPVASMVAGVAVPLAASWFGWRWAFGAVAALLPLAWWAVPAPDERSAPVQTAERAAAGEAIPDGGSADGDGSHRPPASSAATTPTSPREASGRLRLLALGIGAGAGAANAAATLLVPSVTAAGMAVATAGFLLALASVASVVVRIGVGWAADRTWLSPGRGTAGALGVGAVGTALLALTTWPALVVVGAMLTLGAGWGWTGLAFLAAVRLSPEAPARAAGTVLLGLATGGAIGPLVFGAVTERVGPAAGWWSATVAFLLAAGTTLVVSGRTSAD